LRAGLFGFLVAVLVLLGAMYTIVELTNLKFSGAVAAGAHGKPAAAPHR